MDDKYTVEQIFALDDKRERQSPYEWYIKGLPENEFNFVITAPRMVELLREQDAEIKRLHDKLRKVGEYAMKAKALLDKGVSNVE